MTIATSKRQKEKEKRLFGHLIDLFAFRYQGQIQKEIKKSMSQFASSYKKQNYIDYKLIAAHEKRIRAIIFKLYSDSIDASANRQFNSIKKHFPIEMEKKDASTDFQDLALDFITAYGMKLAKQVSETTANQVNRTIARSSSEGLSVSETVSVIRARSSVLSKSRAMTIAVTETHNALAWAKNESTKLIANELNISLKKTWNTVQDERTRQSHQAADGQTVEMDDSFIVGGESLRYAGDINGSAKNTINCRCTETYEKGE